MTDQELHVQIEALAHEEHALRQAHSGGDFTDEERVRLNEVELALDRCWDLLRQRDARRDAGLDPQDAGVRPAEVVENYLQ